MNSIYDSIDLFIKTKEDIYFNEIVNYYKGLIIYKIKSRMVPKNKEDDLYQEALLVLWKSLLTFNDDTHKFLSYYNLCLSRKLNRLIINSSYYKKVIIFDPSKIEDDNHISVVTKYIDKMFNDDKISKDIFRECIIGNTKIITFSEIYNIEYRKVYYKYKNLLRELSAIKDFLD